MNEWQGKPVNQVLNFGEYQKACERARALQKMNKPKVDFFEICGIIIMFAFFVFIMIVGLSFTGGV